MVRKQIYITAEQNSRLRKAARKQRRPEAEIVRDALDRNLGTPPRKGKGFDDDPLWDIVGLSHGPGDLSSNVDDHLYGPMREPKKTK